MIFANKIAINIEYISFYNKMYLFDSYLLIEKHNSQVLIQIIPIHKFDNNVSMIIKCSV